MTHYRLQDRVPSVVITAKGNELKLYQGNVVYLNNGDNFELRFFNPLSEKVGIEINFNGIRKGDSYLVLNPGQDVSLDRFLDENRKMIFETYTIDGNNSEAVKAIEKNGIISFNFFKENNNYYNPYNVTYTYYGGGTYGMSGISGMSGSSGTRGRAVKCASTIPHSKDYWFPSSNGSTVTLDSLNINTTTTTNISGSINEEYFSCDADIQSFATSNANSRIYDPVETGRIEMGDISNQNLKNVNATFASMPFHSFSYQLMPISALAKEVAEIRCYCESCGYRVRKQTWQYCPKCGNKF